MKISTQLLNAFVPLPHNYSAAQLARDCTQLGHECEDVFDPAVVYRHFVVAHIVDAAPHPQADRLQVCQVDAGGATPLTIVCGAANARKGLYTVLALPNAVIPASQTVLKAGKVRGVESQGMMCSAEELALSSHSEGIIELPPSIASTGTPLAQIAPYNDALLTLALTPDRPDALGVYGIAKDLAALWRTPVRAWHDIVAHLQQLLAVDLAHALPLPAPTTAALIHPESACHQLTLLQLQGIDNTQPTPAPLAQMLQRCGMPSKNRLVDVTNLFALLFGRPLHVYDAALVNGQLHARTTHANESFAAINGKSYTLPAHIPVIADQQQAQALSGIMGSATSACSARTRAVWLEAAHFDAATVGRIGREIGIASDSRTRFERGIDPADAIDGIPLWQLAAQCISALCGGTAVVLQQQGTPPAALPALTVSVDLYHTITGHALSPEQQTDLLIRLGFAVVRQNDALHVTPPSYRRDILVPADIIGEMVRLQGIDGIPPTPLPYAAPVYSAPALQQSWILRHAAAARGLHEAMTWSFVAEQELERWAGKDACSTQPQLSYPLSQDMTHLRPHLLIGLLRAVAQNVARGFTRLALFELGQVWHGQQQQYQLCTVRVGGASAPHWQHNPLPANPFNAKADAEALLAVAGVNVDSLTVATDQLPAWLHPYQSGRLCLGPQKTLAYFGMIHTKWAKTLDVPADTALCVIDLAAVPASAGKKRGSYVAHTLQPLLRDFSFVLPDSVDTQTLLRAIRKAGAPLLQHIDVFDVYRGTGIAPAHRALGIQLTLQPTQTLTDEQLHAYGQTIIAAAHKTGASLRGGG